MRHPLTDYLHKHKLSRRHLAQRVGCSPETVKSWLSGRRIMSNAMRKRVSLVTGISQAQLLTFDLQFCASNESATQA